MAVVLTFSGCASDDALAEQANAGDNKNYIAGDGTVVESVNFKGQVTVLNTSYAAWAPCRVEAPHLRALSEKYQQPGIQFIGVNIRDGSTTATAFERTFEINYPSIDDSGGSVLLAMPDHGPAQAVPATLVLDRQGMAAGCIMGLAEKSTLDTLITDAVAEQ